MKNNILYILLLAAIAFPSCKKGVLQDEKKYANVFVSSKAMVDVPYVTVQADTFMIGVLRGGGAVSRLLPLAKDSMTLVVKNTATGDVLLDSVFKVMPDNRFTLLIDQALGITTFYTPSTDVISADTARIQLICNQPLRGRIDRNIKYEIYTTVDMFESFQPTGLSVVARLGVLAAPLSLPVKTPDGAQRRYCLRMLDADTEEVLMAPTPGYSDAQFSFLPGKTAIVKMNVYTDETGDYFNIFDVYPL